MLDTVVFLNVFIIEDHVSGTGNGYGILCPSGTGQIFEYYIDWDE